MFRTDRDPEEDFVSWNILVILSGNNIRGNGVNFFKQSHIVTIENNISYSHGLLMTFLKKHTTYNKILLYSFKLENKRGSSDEQFYKLQRIWWDITFTTVDHNSYFLI